MKKIFHVVFLFCCILFFNNQVFAVIQDDKLVRIKIYCGKGRDGRSGWYDSFFATTTEQTFQGSRYWGGNQGGVGYEITAQVTKNKITVFVLQKGEKYVGCRAKKPSIVTTCYNIVFKYVE